MHFSFKCNLQLKEETALHRYCLQKKVLSEHIFFQVFRIIEKAVDLTPLPFFLTIDKSLQFFIKLNF